MDILVPELKWIGNCCYRLPFLKENSNLEPSRNVEEYVPDVQMDCTDEPCDMEYDIDVLESGSFQLKLSIPKAFWAKLIGAKGAVKRRVEEETRTVLSIPKSNQNGPVVVIGKTRRDVLLAANYIRESVRAARHRMQYTHFLSIPVNSEEITLNYEKFKAQVRELCPSLRCESFTPPEKLHLTLVMLALVDNTELQQACDVFDKLSTVLRKKLLGKELIVNIAGLDIMNDDPSRTSIVYAKAENSILQEIADDAANFFHGSGFVKDKDMRSQVKLHVTLINNSWVQNKEGSGQASRRHNEYFDAQSLLKNLRHFFFGSITVKSIHLSTRGIYLENGYYKSLVELQL